MPPRKRYVSYLRVSTDRQGQSGLGLEAQRAAVARYVDGGELLQEFLEIESGKLDDRPQLAKALHHAKVTGATLLIAKLDRLSRDAHFLLGLQKAGVKFIAADMPEANETMIGFMAIMAQHEREAISRRTKEALAAAKARGVKLGSPKGAAHLRGRYQHLAVAAVKKNAARFAEDLEPVVQDIREAGHTSVRAIAAELNRRGIRTARDKQWHPTSAARLLQRIDTA